MKNLLLLLPFLTLSACVKEENPAAISQLLFECYDPETFGPLEPARYTGFPTDCAFTLRTDDFSGAIDWFERNDADYKLELSGGKYIMQAKQTGGFYVRDNGNFERPVKNYQFEADVKILSSESGRTSGLCFGGLNGFDGVYQFRISKEGSFEVRHLKNNQFLPDILPPTPSQAINSTGTNRLTVRNWQGAFYFFINGALVGQLPNLTAYGSELGFFVGPKSQIEVDNYELLLLEI